MRILALIGVLAIAILAASGIYFYGGFFNVSANAGGNPAVEWSLEAVREASIDKHYQAPTAPVWFSAPKTVQAGAHEFAEEGCVRCHGAPGRARDKFAKGMNPEPPDLGKATKDDPPAKVFWIVKNGIRMTGMPAFGGRMEDEEIWRAVAFAQHEESVTPQQYKTWSSVPRGEAGGHESAEPATSPPKPTN